MVRAWGGGGGGGGQKEENKAWRESSICQSYSLNWYRSVSLILQLFMVLDRQFATIFSYF